MATTALGEALRRWRDRASPEEAGLPAGGRRRAAGLRREELAMLTGVSADYITRLEQGRAANPSVQIVEALARGLRLSAPERGHLFGLAGLAEPGPGTVPSHISPSVRRMLDRLAGTPVAVSDAAWTLLEANAPYTSLMGDPSRWSAEERNGVWRNLVGGPSRVRHSDESRASFEAALVADLRGAAARYPADQRLRRLIADLREHSPRFVELWDSGTVGRHETGRKTIDHPQVGAVTLDCDVLTVAGSELHLLVYTAEPGTEDADRLELITVLGTQTLVE